MRFQYEQRPLRPEVLSVLYSEFSDKKTIDILHRTILKHSDAAMAFFAWNISRKEVYRLHRIFLLVWPQLGDFIKVFTINATDKQGQQPMIFIMVNHYMYKFF